MKRTVLRAWWTKVGRLLFASCLFGAVAALIVPVALPSAAGAMPGKGSGPTKGGTLTMVANGVQPSLDPAIAGISAYPYAPAMMAVYGPGLAYVQPSNGKVVLGFAQAITPSDGFKVWTVVLHSGLKFSDGTAFNAQAVADNIKRLADPSTGSQYASIANTLGLTVVNDTTLKITLPSPNSQFDAVIAADFSAIPSPTAVNSEGANFGAHPVGAGPFTLSQSVLGTSQTFVKNPYFSLFEKGQPYLDKIVLENIASTSQQVAALQTGSAQMAWSSNAMVNSQMTSAGAKQQAFKLQGPFFLAFNNAAPPFNNILAREAVYYALNRTAVAQSWAPGNPVSQTMFNQSSPYYSDKYKWPAEDPSKAQNLFNQLAAAGTPVSFTFMLPEGYPNLAPYVQAALSAYKNVTVKVSTELVPNYVSDLRTGNYQMTGYGVGVPSAVPFLTDILESNGPGNYMRWNNATVDAALKDFVSTSNVARQTSDWETVSAQVVKDFPFVPTQEGVTALDYTSTVAGVHPVWYGEVPIWNEVYLTQ